MGCEVPLCDPCGVMTSAPTHPPREWRRVTRDSENPVLGGVASGLARHLNVPVIWVRVAFVVAAAASGLGIAMYIGLWLVVPSDTRFEVSTPGAESASRTGRRPRRVRRLADAGPTVALAALGLGVIFVAQATLGSAAVFWPIVIGLAGVALLWRQADEVQRERWLDTSGRLDPVRMVFGSGGVAAYARVAAGVLLVVVALVVVGFNGSSFGEAKVALVAGLIGVAGLGLGVGPWGVRLPSGLGARREGGVRGGEGGGRGAPPPAPGGR